MYCVHNYKQSESDITQYFTLQHLILYVTCYACIHTLVKITIYQKKSVIMMVMMNNCIKNVFYYYYKWVLNITVI